MARSIAWNAYEINPEPRQDAWEIHGMDIIAIHYTNPDRTSPERRDREVAGLQARFRADLGIFELASATYTPPDDDRAGYTFAMIFDGRDFIRHWVMGPLREILPKLLEAAQRDGELRVAGTPGR
jgi:hypothetical protein